MHTQRPQEIDGNQEVASPDHAGSTELLVTVTVLAFVAVAAASLFISPQSLQASAGVQAVTESAVANEPAERPFHERYPVQSGGAQSDAPTF